MTDGASGLGGFTSIPEIVRMVQSGDASRWQEGVTTAEDLSRDHAVVSDRGRRALTDLESAWTGGGAEAAHARIGPAVEATFQASSSYQDNARALSDMSHAFEWLKSSLEPMPEQPPTRGFWDHVTPWDTDTEAEINRYAELEEHNRRVYETYAEHTRSAAERVTNDYGWIDEWDSDIALRRTGEGHEQVATEVRTLVDRRDTTETSGRDSRDSSADSDASTAKQRDAGDSRTGTERDEPGLVHPSGPRDPSPVSVHSGESATRDPAVSDRTSSSGYRAPTDPATYRPVAQQPSNVAVPGSPPGGPGTPNPWSVGGSVGGTPVGGYAGSSAGGSTGAGGVRSGGVSPGGVGSGGGKPGVGAAAGSAPGPGRGSGAVPLGQAPGAGQAGARPGGGVAGRAGAMPMGAMGAAGGRGQGGEDTDHQRRYVEDTDEAFSWGEAGDELRDPETGHVVMPPTIGE